MDIEVEKDVLGAVGTLGVTSSWGCSNGGRFVDRARVKRFHRLDAFYGRRVKLNIDLAFAWAWKHMED